MTEPELVYDEVWRQILSRGEPALTRKRRLFKRLPATLRCRTCFAPLEGLSAPLVKIVFDKRPSSTNPFFCNSCEKFVTSHQGGHELEITMLFADVRGSTTVAEGMSAGEFSRLINRFYVTTTEVLTRSDAWIDKLVGDEVTALFFPGMAGSDHARLAVGAAQELLQRTGHANPGGPWIPVGVGVHTGTVFAGTVGKKGGVMVFTVLGDAANLTARLASQAGTGEVLVSKDTCAAAGVDSSSLEQRTLQLKGRNEPVDVSVIRVN